MSASGSGLGSVSNSATTLTDLLLASQLNDLESKVAEERAFDEHINMASFASHKALSAQETSRRIDESGGAQI